jgi:hypothetical protein
MRSQWIPWFIPSFGKEYKMIGKIKGQKFKAWTNELRGGGIPATIEGEISSIDETRSRLKAKIDIQAPFNVYKLKPIHILVFVILGFSAFMTMMFGNLIGPPWLFFAAFPVFLCVVIFFLIGFKGIMGEEETEDLYRILEKLFYDWKLPESREDMT